MAAWGSVAVLLAGSTLLPPPAAAQPQQPEPEPLRLEVAPVPTDPEEFICEFGVESRLTLLEKLNRCDRSVLRKKDTLIVPLDWRRDERDYCPLPREIEWAEGSETLILVHAPMQAFAAYERGELVYWGPISSGGPDSPTPAGAYFLNWRSKGRHSTVNRDWFLRWYFNFENHTGRSFHQYALPGLPASHGCVRLLGRDARWLYDWGRSWRLDEGERAVEEYGTPVVIIGEYDFESSPPWLNPDLVARGFDLSRSGLWAARAAELLAGDRIREALEMSTFADD